MSRPWFQDVASEYRTKARSHLLQFTIGVLIGGAIMLIVLFTSP